MKRYQCHKVVEAAKIESIRALGGAATPTGWQIEFVEEGEPHVQVSNAWAQKHQPKCGGYLVVYGDGYMSFSPALAFETGYTEEGRDNACRAEAIGYVRGAISEGYEPSLFAQDLIRDPLLVGKLSSSFLTEERQRAWDWYNKGGAAHELVDTGLVNCAKPDKEDGPSFMDVTLPVIKWLNDNGHPHHSILIDQTRAALSAEEFTYGTNDYLKD